jgi:alpha,alpha-trehalase
VCPDLRRVCGILALLLSSALILQIPSDSAASSRHEAPSSRPTENFQSLDDILKYISSHWDRLTRSLDQCATYEDTKADAARVLYLPPGAAIPAALNEIQKKCSVRVEHLPANMNFFDPRGVSPEVRTHGLLYLENPYVVPGGQFNEMYGWDSYFIIRGLLRSDRLELAKGMVENFFYEIDHYGGVLNANRTYYLGRSQPPFLTSMILSIYEAERAAGKTNLQWLERAYQYAVADYSQWTRAPHLAGDTGLSRYFDEGNGPVPEIMGDPSDYYRRVAQYFLMHEGKYSPHLVRIDAERTSASVIGPVFELAACDSLAVATREGNCTTNERVALTEDDYEGDRAMRESGFDVSFRFGPYGVDTHHYAPVCLNSLLHKTEIDLAEMSRILNRPDDAARWQQKSVERKEKMDKYLWNGERGLYFDYNFVSHAQSTYEYATTFYPLWTGAASKQQAKAVAATLPQFEQAGGLAMSRYESHAQWDYPYGWAPIQLLALEGLRRYGDAADAERVTRKFLTMILENFRRDHTIREKYNVVTRSSETRIVAGYAQNVIGFGWTNGGFLELLHESSPETIAQIRRD